MSTELVVGSPNPNKDAIEVGQSFFLFPKYSKASGTVVEIVPSEGDILGFVRLVISNTDIEESIFHLNRSKVKGPNGEVLFDATEEYVRSKLAENSESYGE